jgi:hypothetical protein
MSLEPEDNALSTGELTETRPLCPHCHVRSHWEEIKERVPIRNASASHIGNPSGEPGLSFRPHNHSQYSASTHNDPESGGHTSFHRNSHYGRRSRTLYSGWDWGPNQGATTQPDSGPEEDDFWG